jgi:hypothetical protein
VFDLGIARTGLQEDEIKSLGWDYATAKIDSHHRTGYCPDAGRITVKLLAQKHTGRLLAGKSSATWIAPSGSILSPRPCTPVLP